MNALRPFQQRRRRPLNARSLCGAQERAVAGKTPRRAGAYRTGNMLLLHAVAYTRAGIGVLVPPVHRFTSETDPGVVGAALSDLLASPPSIVPPDGWKDRAEMGKQFLKAAGFRSWKQLEARAVYCSIEAGEERITLTPLRNGGTRGDKKGFQPFGAPVVTVAVDAPTRELGAAVSEALHRSQ
jgi:hypothetical protein